NQPTNSYIKYCELVGFFVSLGIPPQIRFGSQNGGNFPTKIWQKYKIFQKFTQLSGQPHQNFY
ncbi:hypothetical protein, partial [Odoribacter splanchnicus]|uniref:hypothetical protein n=1 Tax=Odoribacter splanchnicus TaxID=28118 RepID=UPI001C70F583